MRRSRLVLLWSWWRRIITTACLAMTPGGMCRSRRCPRARPCMRRARLTSRRSRRSGISGRRRRRRWTARQTETADHPTGSDAIRGRRSFGAAHTTAMKNVFFPATALHESVAIHAWSCRLSRRASCPCSRACQPPSRGSKEARPIRMESIPRSTNVAQPGGWDITCRTDRARDAASASSERILTLGLRWSRKDSSSIGTNRRVPRLAFETCDPCHLSCLDPRAVRRCRQDTIFEACLGAP